MEGGWKMKLETLGRLIAANRAARAETERLISSWDAFTKSDLQTKDGQDWALEAREEAKTVLVEIDEHMKLLLEQYWETL